jgi:uncharacterized protein (TIGR03435 family)
MTAVQFLVEWAIRSTALLLCGALVLTALRVKDPSVRLAAWVAMLLGSLAIPAMTMGLPAVPVTVTRDVVRPVVEAVTVYEAVPMAVASPAGDTSKPHPRFDRALATLVLYAAVAFALLLRLGVGLMLSWRLLRGSGETDLPGVRQSERVAAPVTLGILRPTIMLPVDWRDWDESKLTAVLAHERSHIGRWDPAVQLVSAIHRMILWFSPAVWFLHSRIVRVAEEASDDAAVAITRDRVSYAEVLLEFMRRGVCGAGVPMARYGNGEARIHRILDATSISRGMTGWSVIAIVGLTGPITYLVASVTPHDVAVRSLPVIRNSVAAATAAVQVHWDLPVMPRMVAQVAAPAKPGPVYEARPKFDVASIKPCDPDAVPVGGRGRGGASSDRFRRNCIAVKSLITDAYIRFANGDSRSPFQTILTKVEGGPDWLDSDQYTIEAEADGGATPPMMAGPMMQRLLEDRFQLKVHRETREGPVYELTVAKGGSKIQAAKETPCVAADFEGSPFPPFAQGLGDTRPCRMIWSGRKGPNMVLRARGISMEEVTLSLTGATGRLVIGKTGIAGNIDINLIYAPDENTPGPLAAKPAEGVPVADDPVGPSLFTALQELGLKLEPARGAREYLVIDSVSRPSAN